MKTSWSTVLLAAAGLVVSTAVVDGQTRVGGDVTFCSRPQRACSRQGVTR